MIKRVVFFTIILLALVFVSPKQAQAASLIADLQNRISALETAVGNLLTRLLGAENNILTIFSRLATDEASIANHETRIVNLENTPPDFTPPASWTPTFSAVNQSITLIANQRVPSACVWNGSIINSMQVQVRAVAHLNLQDVYATGNCNIINFTNITNFPVSGSSFVVDLDLFWQGRTKHSSFSLVAP